MLARGAPVAPGDLIDGRYLVEALLGSGGMAVVYRARHTGTGAACALKLVHPHLVPRSELRELFLREARVGGRIGKNRHFVDVVDAGYDTARAQPYLVMELLEGETLEDLSAREGALTHALVAVLLGQIADALDQAHGAGVVHRDLKPGNLFLVLGRRGQPCVKVMDFGIAKVLEAGAHHTATQIGTPAYAAPEQMGPSMRAAAARQGVTVAAAVSPATDVWALGLLAYELCTGLPAAQFWGAEASAEIPIKAVLFPHDAASSRAGDRAALLPAGFDAWFARATNVDAACRFPAAGLAVAELVALFDAGEAETTRTPPPEIADPVSYGPGTTELTGTPVAVLSPSPIPGATAGTWAERTPPPGSAPPPAAAARRAVPAGERSRFSSAVLVVAALLGLVGLGGAGAAVFLGRPLGPTAASTCRAAGQRCADACDTGDAWSCGRLAARHEHGSGVPRDEARAAALYEKACDASDAFACAGLGRLVRLGRGGLARDPARARVLFEKACGMEHAADGGPGDPDATRGCALLGEAYRDGTGVAARDDTRAVALFRDACAHGDATGCKDLGTMHQYGRGGLARDEAAAAARYREACDGGEVLGCNDLGVLVGSGRGGLATDPRLAGDLYRRACDGGAMLGCDNLAWMIEHGQGGLAADPARAAALYKEACDQGDARGCGNLAVMIERGIAGLPADPPRAAALYEEACDQGDAHACDNLGTMVEQGKGGLVVDLEKAGDLYRRACDAGDPDGCGDLGRLVEAGRGGQTRDDARAVSLYEHACDGGALRGCVNLGVLVAAGRGASRDERRAVTLWQRGCDGGLPAGCADLGWAYYLGHGVLRDRAHGLELLRGACTGGNPWACDRLDEAQGKRPAR
jgi:TPR repeat protein